MLYRLAEPNALRAMLAERLPEVVRAALGKPNVTLGRWGYRPLNGGFHGLEGECLAYVVDGVALGDGGEQSWSLVLKVWRPVASQDNPSHMRYWKREALVYGSGLLDALTGGLRAPRCSGSDEMPDGTIWLWLEHVREDGAHRWSHERWALAARHLGQFNGAYLIGTPLPEAPWLGGRRLRTWLDTHQHQVARIAAAPENPEVRRWWPRPVVEAVLSLWRERDVFCDALERLPQTFGHGDAIRRNLFSRRRADGSEETIAIDWEHAGYYAVGEEVGQTLSVASAFFDLDPTELTSLDAALFASYLDGLRDAGWRGDPIPVRFAFATHAVLRNAFNAVGATAPDPERRAAIRENQGHSWEDLAERRAAIRPFLLDRADEARHLAERL